jgi:hypothetical protein
MKIALCLSGQPRSFQKGYEYHKLNLLDHYDVDVYIHSHSHIPQELIDLYKPKSFLFGELDTSDTDAKYTNTPNAIKHPPRFTKTMFSSIYECGQLIQGQYDWVIRSRTDFALNCVIPFPELDKEKLYLPIDASDQFAFGNQKNMMMYMETFKNLDLYYNQGVRYIGEDMMRANFEWYRLKKLLVLCDLNFPFPPGPYNCSQHALIRDDHSQWKNY